MSDYSNVAEEPSTELQLQFILELLDLLYQDSEDEEGRDDTEPPSRRPRLDSTDHQGYTLSDFESVSTVTIHYRDTEDISEYLDTVYLVLVIVLGLWMCSFRSS
ncbi:hypothetical protein ROHU_030314 [Labeo rohita]|uniref:Uncharacterized protein n=1 Tax=Labeo rohita TaxID=84645 RepID=A0A498LV16_LABRO|nr:hypothetical protein ROHU_030314 [Labeo rohita]